jgi:hypothetical protein
VGSPALADQSRLDARGEGNIQVVNKLSAPGVVKGEQVSLSIPQKVSEVCQQKSSTHPCHALSVWLNGSSSTLEKVSEVFQRTSSPHPCHTLSVGLNGSSSTLPKGYSFSISHGIRLGVCSHVLYKHLLCVSVVLLWYVVTHTGEGSHITPVSVTVPVTRTPSR